MGEHYVHPGSIITVAVVFPVITILAVTNRVYSRHLKQISLGVEDYLSIASAIILVACSIDLLVGVTSEPHALGYHSPKSNTYFNLPGIVILDKVEWSFNLMWYVGITLVKLSFLFFYRRIFRGKLFSIFNYAIIGLAVAWGITFFFVTLFQCGKYVGENYVPLPQFFSPKCVNSLAVFFANSLMSCFMDVLIVVMPMPLIWQLNMRTRAKVALTGMFALGAFCVTASALRLALYSELWWAVKTHNQGASILGLTGADDFGIVSLALFWSQIELGVANITCCLPSLKPLVESQQFRNLPSAISQVSLRSLRKIVRGGKTSSKASSSEYIETKNGQIIRESQAESRGMSIGSDDTWKHERQFGSIDTSHYQSHNRSHEGGVTSVYGTAEGGSNPEPGAIEEGSITRKVVVEQRQSSRS